MRAQKGMWETGEGTFGYRVDGGKDESGGQWITVTDYRGTNAYVHVPAKIDGLAVRAVAKKAFLSRKNLRKVFLPEGLREIGDWAFAYCTNLESVELPGGELKLGSRIFMECPGIRRIYVDGVESEQVAALLAAAAVMLDAEYLLDVQEAGTPAWLKKWDARMHAVMDAEDGDGYTKMILCGEEDYGCSLEEFVRNKRKGKVRLVLLRLLNPIGLPEETAALWKAYLLEHTKGCETEETWEVVLGEHGYEEEYFRLFTEIGALNEENFDALLMDMGEGYAEMKAFFIGYRQSHMAGTDFFEGLGKEL